MADDGADKDEGRKGRKKFNLEFVNMNAASAAERERNQKVVRSTAMKSFRRRQKSQREEGESSGKGKKKLDTTNAIVSEPSAIVKSELPVSRDPPASSVPTVRPSQVTYSDISWFVGSPSSSSSDSSSGEEGSSEVKPIQMVQTAPLTQGNLQVSSAYTSPRSWLGAGRVDPFRVYPVDVNNTSHAPELLDHSLTVLWHGLRPQGDSGTITSLGAAWLEKTNERPIVMHAMLFGAQVHLDVLRSPRLSLDNPVRLYHKVQTVRLLKDELKHPENIPIDDIILAILTLSANEVETVANNAVEDKVRSPFNSPLANTQWLDVYGSITHLAAHTTAMRTLVARRGGLEKIELEGLAEVLSFSDILGATQSLKKPHWPLLNRTLTVDDIYIPEILKVPLKRLGEGFQELVPSAITDQFLSAIGAIVNLTVMIDCHCQGTKPIVDLAQYIDRRNAVQHQLLSLPFGEELVSGEIRSTSIYESIRLATLIYSAAVTFPLPALTGIFHQLASTLRTVLEKSRADPHWRYSSKALVWILALGGITAAGSNDRSWYAQNLSTVSSAMKISTWNELSMELERFLWLRSACDSAGQALWMEVKSLRGRAP
ncbi:uncharacterized protein LY89DRAFT_780437 [Mollisia scopiformis]|uniref:Tachykinin family protein n=1 Tax=Mollisia scopiformis TaxID=149040 RepID=A0A194XIB8_MOLSC|nr:uncharacterized protein LY89DRAFT_780437 [Mollisia scopiformis]KUJ19512.1 hypothetical protein LY89DRAFT_780437 [Mollisia scopiformis]